MTREEAGFRGAVAFFSPGWPRDSFPNGIITYVDAMREGLRALGTRAIVLTRAMRPECAEPDVIDVLPDGPRSFAARVRGRLIGAREARWRDLTTNIVRELQRLRREQDVRVFEMEETFGLAGRVARESPVPVVQNSGTEAISSRSRSVASSVMSGAVGCR